MKAILSIFCLFLSVCINKTHGHQLVGKVNNCTSDDKQSNCEVQPNDVITFNLTCNPSFVQDFKKLKLPKGSLILVHDEKELKIHVANVIGTKDAVAVEYTEDCDGTSRAENQRKITYKEGGNELKMTGVDFTGASIHFNKVDDKLTENKTYEVDVGKWEKIKTFGFACPSDKLEDIKCFNSVLDKENEVTIESLIPSHTFDYLKYHVAGENPKKDVETLVAIKEFANPENKEVETKDFTFTCKCTVASKKVATLNFKGTIDVIKGGVNPPPSPPTDGDLESTDPDHKNEGSSLTASVHKMFGLLSVFLYFYLNN